MITHIYETTQALFKDDANRDNFFYHDAISVMTAASMINWMRSKDILKH